MKKFLMTSTALVLALPLTTQSVSASSSKIDEKTPRLQLSGELSPQFHALKNKKREGNGGKGFGQHLAVEDSRINFDVLGKTDALGGLEYGFLAGLSLDTGGTGIEEARISLKNAFGTVMIGDTRGVDDFMAVGPWRVMGGTGGGMYGNMTSTYQPTSGVRFSGDLVNTPKDATKINYITPRFAGFQAGITYTPDSKHDGVNKLSSHTNDMKKTQHFFPNQPFDHRQIGLGVNYKNTFQNGMNFQVSLTGLYGHPKSGSRKTAVKTYVPNAAVAENATLLATPASIHRTKAYAVGALFGWQGFKVAGEYINNGKSGEPRALKGSNAGHVYNGALSYSWNVHSVAAGYGHSVRKLGTSFKKAKADVYTLTYDHTFAPGLEGFVEGNFAKLKTDVKYVNFVATAKSKGAGGNDPVGNSNTKGAIIGGRVRF